MAIVPSCAVDNVMNVNKVSGFRFIQNSCKTLGHIRSRGSEFWLLEWTSGIRFRKRDCSQNNNVSRYLFCFEILFDRFRVSHGSCETFVLHIIVDPDKKCPVGYGSDGLVGHDTECVCRVE